MSSNTVEWYYKLIFTVINIYWFIDTQWFSSENICCYALRNRAWEHIYMQLVDVIVLFIIVQTCCFIVSFRVKNNYGLHLLHGGKLFSRQWNILWFYENNLKNLLPGLCQRCLKIYRQLVNFTGDKHATLITTFCLCMCSSIG